MLRHSSTPPLQTRRKKRTTLTATNSNDRSVATEIAIEMTRAIVIETVSAVTGAVSPEEVEMPTMT